MFDTEWIYLVAAIAGLIAVFTAFELLSVAIEDAGGSAKRFHPLDEEYTGERRPAA